MKNNKRLKLVFMASILALAGCQQYLERSDRVSLSAGNTHAVNETRMVVDPWPTYLDDTDIGTNGNRMSSAVETYRTGSSTQSSGTSVVTTPSNN